MSTNQYLKLINQRNIIKETFPRGNLMVSYDLILYICIQASLGKNLNVKQLFSSVDKSYSVIRKYYFNLISQEYIISVFQDKNKKTKFILPTEKSFKFLKTICDC
jgi:predicted transcriptional regulator